MFFAKKAPENVKMETLELILCLNYRVGVSMDVWWTEIGGMEKIEGVRIGRHLEIEFWEHHFVGNSRRNQEK